MADCNVDNDKAAESYLKYRNLRIKILRQVLSSIENNRFLSGWKHC